MKQHGMPMTIGQQGLWYLSQVDDSVNAAYNVVVALETSQALDVSCLSQALNAVVAAHPQLGARILVEDFAPVLEPGTDMPATVREVDGVLADVAQAESSSPFNLEQAPLCRATVVHTASPASHGLVLCVPHIVFDGQSVSVMLDQLAYAYSALASGDKPKLEDAQWGSGDQAALESAYLGSEAGQGRVKQVLEQLLARPAEPIVPMKAQATPGYAFASEMIEVLLPAGFGARVRAFAQAEAFSAAAIYLAALRILLWQHSGCRSAGISLPVSCRDTEAAQRAVGYFTNLAVSHGEVRGDATVLSLLESVSDELFDVLDHRHLPYPELVRAYKIATGESLSGDGLIGFNYQRTERAQWDFAGIRASNVTVPSRYTKDRLRFEVEDTAEGVRCVLDFDKHAYSRDMMASMMARFVALLQRMLDDPGACLNALPMHDPADLQRLLVDWNGPRADIPSYLPVHALFEAKAQAQPERVALIVGNHALSYAELNQRANRVAHQLRRHGAGAECLVGVCVERNADAVIALLAVLKAGAAYLPLDPEYPPERIEYMLRDAGARLVLTQAACRTRLPAEGITCMAMDTAMPDRADDEGSNGAHAGHADNLAYCIYTSGSTGTPKGVVVSMGALSGHVQTCIAMYQYTSADRVLQFASTSFDASIEQMLAPLCAGATLVLRPSELWSPTELVQVIRAQSLTVADIPAAYWHHYATSSDLKLDGTALRLLIVGGEPIKLSGYPDAARSIRVLNAYGPTEATVTASMGEWASAAGEQDGSYASIGRPVSDTRIYIVNAALQLVSPGVMGEICIAGPRLARGYLNRPDLTAGSFVPDPFGEPGARMYRTGDLGRHLPDGTLQFIGRRDHQIKLRGFRIELGEIETRLAEHPSVQDAVVLALGDDAHKRLVAYVVPSAYDAEAPDRAAQVAQLRTHLGQRLPDYMVPAAFVLLAALPLFPNGKLDRAALPPPDDAAFARPTFEAPRSATETALATIWQTLLGLARVGIHDNYFEVGGTSLHIVGLKQAIQAQLGVDVSVTDLFAYPTIARLAAYLHAGSPPDAMPDAVRDAVPEVAEAPDRDGDIAVIGMAGRFPGAADVDTLWTNLAHGVESLRRYTREELQQAGVDPALLDHPQFVPVRSLMDGVEDFDAAYFGFTPREAEVTDPQQRILLECAHEALERAGYGDARAARPVGVFVGVGDNHYVLRHLLPQREAFAALGATLVHANSKDAAATRISYKLNLSGPSLSVSTACSTSLVAVHLACRSLACGESRMALAGAAGIAEFGPGGYRYEEGNIDSPDGHCRTFDRDAQGTRGGNGAGVVLLKRLADALADGDTIHALIKGSAINNDGADKVGYTAPSVSGQMRAIRQAYRQAGVAPATVQYVEAHGTGTVLGDPIEMRALSQAFAGVPAQSCAVGSIKPNIGHLDAAAGVAGLIKTVLALTHRQLPPSINYTHPNPQIDFAASPFYVNTQLRDWPAPGGPRRAGVSSFGIGGTNVHVVLEEAPAVAAAAPARPVHVLLLSARSAAALDTASAQLAAYLGETHAAPLAEVAYTLQVGRTAHAYRRAVAAATAAEAIAALTAPAAARPPAAAAVSVVWLFPGQGTQHVGMAQALYASEPVFRAQLDACAEGLREALGLDVRALLYPAPAQQAEAAHQLAQTQLAQPALFAVCYSLARMLQSYGVSPAAMIGHSLGEYVAACLAGVFSLADGLRLVAARGRLMQAMAAGRMLSVPLDEARLRARLAGSALSLAAVNGAQACVVSGPGAAIAALREQLRGEGIEGRELDTSHAFHSAMMEPMLQAWRDTLATVSLQAPTIPYLSNLSGRFITAEEATAAAYWVDHLRHTVRFSAGLDALLDPSAPLAAPRVFLEVGPGQVLSSLVTQHLRQAAPATPPAVVSLLGRAGTDAARALPQALGQLWAHGVPLAWADYHASARRQRVPLPTYPFARQRFWVDAPPAGAAPAAHGRQASVEDWFHTPLWRLRGTPARTAPPAPAPRTWLVLGDRGGLGDRLAASLRQAGHRVIGVRHADAFADAGADDYTLDIAHEPHYHALAERLAHAGTRLDHLVHLGSLDPLPEDGDRGIARFEARQRSGYDSLMFLLKALLARAPGDAALTCHAVTHDAFRVTGSETLAPEQATLTGLCKVAPQEYPHLRCQHIDLSHADGLAGDAAQQAALSARLLDELLAGQPDPVVAWRGPARWTLTYAPQRVAEGSTPPRLKRGGVYAITGGLGQVGYALAEHLATLSARLLIIVRDALPPRAQWANWIAEHGPGDRWVPKLGRLLALEAKGAQVLVCTADVADEAAMIEAFDQAELRFGALDGVIHCAGEMRHAVTALADGSVAHYRAQCRPKVQGTLVLQRVLKHRHVEFCVLMSSLSAVLGGLGFAAYAATNAYLDAFAAARHAHGEEAWLSINWDGWQVAGAPGEADVYAMSGPEGARALAHALAWADVPQLVHATGDLTARREAWIDRRAPAPAGMQVYARGGRAQAIAPSTTIESQLVEIWQQLLGVADLGVRDPFFALGGDSLLATMLVARVNKTFQVNLPIRVVFEEETIERIALQIDELTKRPPQGKPLALKRSGERAPLFCIHPGSGFGRPYLSMLRHLPPDLPVYALEARGLNEGDVLPDTLGDMCADYIAQIRLIQPHGPYQLLGWSFGAIAAHAMAAEMQTRGLAVAKLVMIDGCPFGDEPWPEQSIAEHRRDLETRLASYKEYQNASDDMKQAMVARMSAIQSNNIRLSYYRDPAAFDGNTLLVFAKETEKSNKYDFYKNYLRGAVSEIEVPYHHNILLTSEALESYGPQIRQFLDAQHVTREPTLEVEVSE